MPLSWESLEGRLRRANSARLAGLLSRRSALVSIRRNMRLAGSGYLPPSLGGDLNGLDVRVTLDAVDLEVAGVKRQIRLGGKGGRRT